MKIQIFAVNFFLFIGISLLALNAWGILHPIDRNNNQTSISSERQLGDISYDDAMGRLSGLHELDPLNIAILANEIIFLRVLHYWEEGGRRDYAITIPARENFILSIMQHFHGRFVMYEFCEFEKALERGVGWCSQRSIALADFLGTSGIAANIVGLNDHVVVQAVIDEREYILDPTYNVIVPYGIDDLNRSPHLARSYYSGQSVDWEDISYVFDGNGVQYVGGVAGYIDCNLNVIRFERLSYIVKWLLPILIVLLAIFPFWLGRWASRRSDT